MCRYCGKIEGNNSFVAISAHITEAARFYLWKLLKQAGRENVLYCDTDSIKLSQQYQSNLKNYISQNEFGMLKVEDVFNDFTIYGAKAYITEKGRKLKGVPKQAIQKSECAFQYPSFLGQKTHMQKGVTDCFLVHSTVKKLAYTYDKGTVLPSGKVIPFDLPIPF